MHSSLSGFVLSDSVRKSTKPSCFCRIGSTSFSNLLPTCSRRPAFDWHSTIRANIEVSPFFLYFSRNDPTLDSCLANSFSLPFVICNGKKIPQAPRHSKRYMGQGQ